MRKIKFLSFYYDILAPFLGLFLAGLTRTRASANVKVGVHSLADGNKEATGFPNDSAEHDLFIDYYKAVGYSDQWSRDFYFYTINTN